MRDKSNISDVAALNPDYMGFIFYAPSPRYVGEDFTVEFSPTTKRVGVFVNETTEAMVKKVHALKLDYLQLHGQETVKQCEDLKTQGIKIIKVFSVDDEFDFSKTTPYKPVVDFFLFDTKGKYYGGNAVAFNWNILKQYDQQVPFFLSGGIAPANAEEIKKMGAMNMHAVDLNSGVELAPALKDVNKIIEIKKILNSIS